MSNQDPKAICGNCVHFAKDDATCRKYAPRGKSKWRPVTKTDWCSEFEKKPPEIKPKGHVYAG